LFGDSFLMAVWKDIQTMLQKRETMDLLILPIC